MSASFLLVRKGSVFKMKITVGVVGLGLIGASFAKAYKENEREAVVYGWNRTKSISQMAKMQGVEITEKFNENTKKLEQEYKASAKK
jgi:prephenate dehydrogenase